MRLLNQHSFVVVTVTLVAATFGMRFLPGPRWAWPAAVLVLAAAFFAATRYGPGHEVRDLDRALASGRPVAVEFYSDL